MSNDVATVSGVPSDLLEFARLACRDRLVSAVVSVSIGAASVRARVRVIGMWWALGDLMATVDFGVDSLASDDEIGQVSVPAVLLSGWVFDSSEVKS